MTSINRLSKNIINFYDRNRDGQISLRGRRAEDIRYIRERTTHFDEDVITLTRYAHTKLFEAADKNNDGSVTREELKAILSGFDKNNDGKLENHGPFWKRRGEKRDFNKAFPEEWRIIERHVIPRPRPFPGHPHNPRYPRDFHFGGHGFAMGIKY